MIMLCLTRAITVLAIAFAVIPMTSCGHRLAENKGAKPAAPASGTASDMPLSAGHDSDPDAAHEAGARMMHSTLVELHHFNVYKNFHGMLDASSDAPDSANHRDAPGAHSRAATNGTIFACSSSSLVKQGD